MKKFRIFLAKSAWLDVKLYLNLIQLKRNSNLAFWLNVLSMYWFFVLMLELRMGIRFCQSVGAAGIRALKIQILYIYHFSQEKFWKGKILKIHKKFLYYHF